MGDPKAVEGMARYGIRATKAWGVSAPKLHKLAKKIGRIDSKSARWIAADALRELTGDKVHARLAR